MPFARVSSNGGGLPALARRLLVVVCVVGGDVQVFVCACVRARDVAVGLHTMASKASPDT